VLSLVVLAAGASAFAQQGSSDIGAELSVLTDLRRGTWNAAATIDFGIGPRFFSSGSDGKDPLRKDEDGVARYHSEFNRMNARFVTFFGVEAPLKKVWDDAVNRSEDEGDDRFSDIHPIGIAGLGLRLNFGEHEAGNLTVGMFTRVFEGKAIAATYVQAGFRF